MTEIKSELDEIIESMEEYGIPEYKGKWRFSSLAYCITHRVFFYLIKRTQTGHVLSKVEILIELGSIETHFKEECNYLSKQEEFMGAYHALKEVRGDYK